MRLRERGCSTAGRHGCAFDESVSDLPCTSTWRADDTRADLLARLPVLRVSQWLEPCDKAKEILEIHQSSSSRWREVGTDRIAADGLAEAVSERNGTRELEINADVRSQSEAGRCDRPRRRVEALCGRKSRLFTRERNDRQSRTEIRSNGAVQAPKVDEAIEDHRMLAARPMLLIKHPCPRRGE